MEVYTYTCTGGGHVSGGPYSFDPWKICILFPQKSAETRRLVNAGMIHLFGSHAEELERQIIRSFISPAVSSTHGERVSIGTCCYFERSVFLLVFLLIFSAALSSGSADQGEESRKVWELNQ